MYQLETEVRSRCPLLRCVTKHLLSLLAHKGCYVLIGYWIYPRFPDNSRYIGNQIFQAFVFSFGKTGQSFRLYLSLSFSCSADQQTQNKECLKKKEGGKDEDHLRLG